MKTQDLIDALTTVKPGLGNNELFDQTNAFLFKDGQVVAYNDEICISHPIDIDENCAVKAEELYQFLKKVKTDEIDVSVNDDQELVLKAGKSRVGLKMQKDVSTELPDLDDAQWTDLPDGLIKSLEFVSIAASTDAATPALTCIHIRQDGVIEATDRHRICQYEQQALADHNILISADVVANIKALSPTMVSIDKNWIHFMSEDEAVISCKTFKADFPDIDSKLEAIEGQKTKIKFPSKLIGVIEKALIFTKQDHVYDEYLEITLDKNNMNIHAKSDYAWFDEDLKIVYKGQPFKFHIIPRLFIDILQNEIEQVMISDKMIEFKGTDWTYYAAVSKL